MFSARSGWDQAPGASTGCACSWGGAWDGGRGGELRSRGLLAFFPAQSRDPGPRDGGRDGARGGHYRGRSSPGMPWRVGEQGGNISPLLLLQLEAAQRGLAGPERHRGQGGTTRGSLGAMRSPGLGDPKFSLLPDQERSAELCTDTKQRIQVEFWFGFLCFFPVSGDPKLKPDSHTKKGRKSGDFLFHPPKSEPDAFV